MGLINVYKRLPTQSFHRQIKNQLLGIGGCRVWVKSNIGVESSAGRVTTWFDQSGRRHNFTTTGNAPQNNVTNPAKPTIDFTSTNSEWLSTALTGNSDTQVPPPFTVFVTAKFSATSNPGGVSDFDYVWSRGFTNTNAALYGLARWAPDGSANADKLYAVERNTGAVAVAYGPVHAVNTFKVYCQEVNTSAPYHKLYIDNVEQTITDTNAGMTGVTATCYLGAVSSSSARSNFLTGSILEFVYFDKILSTAERLRVYDLLAAYRDS
jgi:hypothetical protein